MDLKEAPYALQVAKRYALECKVEIQQLDSRFKEEFAHTENLQTALALTETYCIERFDLAADQLSFLCGVPDPSAMERTYKKYLLKVERKTIAFVSKILKWLPTEARSEYISDLKLKFAARQLWWLSEINRLHLLKHPAPSQVIEASRKQRGRRVRPKAPCFLAAIKLLEAGELGPREFCVLMDRKAEQYPGATKYKPPPSWKVRSFLAQYEKRSNTVSRFLSEVRKHSKLASKQRNSGSLP